MPVTFLDHMCTKHKPKSLLKKQFQLVVALVMQQILVAVRIVFMFMKKDLHHLYPNLRERKKETRIGHTNSGSVQCWAG